MSKPNRKTSGGINIQSKEVHIGGDIVDGNNTVKQIMQPNNVAEANQIMDHIVVTPKK